MKRLLVVFALILVILIVLFYDGGVSENLSSYELEDYSNVDVRGNLRANSHSTSLTVSAHE